MSQLAKLQSMFQSSVLKPDANKKPTWVSAAGRTNPERQLSVYSFAYRARLKEVLATDFPAVHMAIGDDGFYTLAENYIAAHPSHYFSLRDFGASFAFFIHQDVSFVERPWLYELASFEWALVNAFDAADAPVVGEDVMAGISPENWPALIFKMHPSVHRLSVSWNIPDMWKTLTSDTPTEMTAQQGEETCWLIWRDKLVTRFRSMAQDENCALATACAGKCFDEICEAMTGFLPVDEVPLRAASLLKTWIQQGLIQRLLRIRSVD